MADPIIGKISVGDGATFTPAVDSDGVISWTNNKNLPNPASVDIPQAVMNRYQIAPIASPAFTGNPTAPTQAKTDNSTKLATTAYVKAVVADYLELTGGSITGDVDITGDLSVSGAITGNLTGNADTATNATNDANGNPIAGTYLPLSGGTLTGVVNGVTPPNGDNSKKLATTEFVNAKAGNYLPLSGGSITGDVDITGDLFLSGATGYVNNGKVFSIGNTDPGNVDLGWSWANREGAGIGLRSTDYLKNPGDFSLYARDSANSCSLEGKPDGTLTWGGQPLLPVGIVQAFAGTTIPTGWLLCDGSAVSRTDYAALYAVIGTTYGSGNGSTTFNLPNLVDKFVEGSATAGTVKSAGLPNITGSITNIIGRSALSTSGSISASRGDVQFSSALNENNYNYTISINARSSSTIYGNSSTVQPPALTMRYIIKY